MKKTTANRAIIKPIKQKNDSACGPTCIYMVLKALDTEGANIKYEQIIKTAKFKKSEGMSNLELVETLKTLGRTVNAQSNLSYEDLAKLCKENKFVIVSWALRGYIGHFSIVHKVNKNTIELIDPEVGKITKMNKIIFMRLWLDYDDMWWPEKNTDIQLRWACTIN